MDILMGFSTGFVVIYNLRRKVIRDPRLIAEYYTRYSTFVVDLLAALPIIAEVGPSGCAEYSTSCRVFVSVFVQSRSPAMQSSMVHCLAIYQIKFGCVYRS
jgi:hypothetical protein